MTRPADGHIRRMAERERRRAVLRRVREFQRMVLARCGGVPIPAELIDGILEDESDRKRAGAPADIIEAEAHAMATYTSSGALRSRTDDAEADDFAQTAEYRRRMMLIRRIKEIQEGILADRGGVPIPREVIDEVLDEVKRGE